MAPFLFTICYKLRISVVVPFCCLWPHLVAYIQFLSVMFCHISLLSNQDTYDLDVKPNGMHKRSLLYIYF